MPLFLTSLMTGVFSGFMSFFLKFFTRKLALAATFLALTLTMVAAFVAALSAALSTISYVTPDFIADGFGLVMPPNYVTCLGAMYAANVAKFIFDRNRDIVNGQMRLFS